MRFIFGVALLVCWIAAVMVASAQCIGCLQGPINVVGGAGSSGAVGGGNALLLETASNNLLLENGSNLCLESSTSC